MRMAVLAVGGAFALAACASLDIGAMQKEALKSYYRMYISPTTFGDERVSVSASYIHGMEGIPLSIANRSGEIVSVNWDGMSLVGPNKEAQRVIHGGVKLNNANNAAQAPTVLPPGARVTDSIFPAENIYWNSYLSMWDRSAVWAQFMTADDPSSLVGLTGQVVFSYTANGTQQFVVQDVVITKVERMDSKGDWH